MCTGPEAAETAPILDDLNRRRTRYLQASQALERKSQLVSAGRLISFLGIAIVGGAGWSQESEVLLGVAAGLVLLFIILIIMHARLIKQQRRDDARARVYERHLKRLTGEWTSFTDDGDSYIARGHEYARDIDIVGPGSLFQRIDVSHTRRGAQTLATWLSEKTADLETLRARQVAVRELQAKVELREDLEAAIPDSDGATKVDDEGFRAFVARESYFTGRGWMVALMHLTPILAIGSYIAAELEQLSWWVFFAVLALQLVVLRTGGIAANQAFDLIAARRGYLEAFQRLLLTMETATCEAALLKDLQVRIQADGRPPSIYFRQLDRWAGLAELRTQFPLNIIANLFLLWDLHVLYRLEKWNEDIGDELDRVFEAMGEFEAFSSLATLAYLEPGASFPELLDGGDAFEADALAHPLLPAASRVPNDVRLTGPKSALLVTGSNMAGKSTLLRSVGLGIALGLSGGPVIAKRAQIPAVRLRASMRAEDDLQQGASYFRAELQKLETVIGQAEDEPRLFFLLDELLRGTNARARHLGARAIMMHLLSRGASGLVATHDAALGALESRDDVDVTNVHFTDVMNEGEMFFDYRLRPGIVKTSNALRLLRAAGVDVPEEDLSALVS